MLTAKHNCFTGTKAHKIMACRDKEKPGDTRAERKPDGIYQGCGRASEVTGKVGYAKQHQEKMFQNKTRGAKLLKQNKEEVEKILTN